MGPGPNSEQIRKIGPEWDPEIRQSIGNPYQMEDNKAAPSAPPKGAALRAAPLGSCCLPFSKDFLSFCFISGARSGPISRIWFEFGPGPIQDLKSYSLAFLALAASVMRQALCMLGPVQN